MNKHAIQLEKCKPYQKKILVNKSTDTTFEGKKYFWQFEFAFLTILKFSYYLSRFKHNCNCTIQTRILIIWNFK